MEVDKLHMMDMTEKKPMQVHKQTIFKMQDILVTSFLTMSFLLSTFRDWKVTFEAIALQKPALFSSNYHQVNIFHSGTQGYWKQ